jgi:N-acetylglucosaminyl-diphospho-decaprenol L-rhamnosyltransferase
MNQVGDHAFGSTQMTSTHAGPVDCAVVIVTYNSGAHIDALLDSLAKSAPGLSLRVVVVDNGSVDATVNIVSSRAGVTCVRSARNDGYAAGINIGRMHAGGFDALLVLNPDVMLEEDSIAQMFSALQSRRVGIVVPKLTDRAGNLLFSPSLQEPAGLDERNRMGPPRV